MTYRCSVGGCERAARIVWEFRPFAHFWCEEHAAVFGPLHGTTVSIEEYIARLSAELLVGES